MKKLTLLMMTLLFSLSVKSEEEVITCFPKNNLRFSKQNKSLAGISEQEVSQLITRVKTVYSPIFKQTFGKDLIINNLWAEATVDANATRDPNMNLVVNIYGGIARHPQMTRDGLLLIICHEVGHHLGGAPKAFRGNTKVRGWSSAEGEADYFAATKCLPKVFSDDLDAKSLDIDIDTPNLKNAMARCKDDLCSRIVLAGKSVSDVFASLKQGTPTPNILVQDKTVATTTIYNHPNPQCRLDTYMAGARCDISADLLIDNANPSVGACQGSAVGARPSCWYNEGEF